MGKCTRAYCKSYDDSSNTNCGQSFIPFECIDHMSSLEKPSNSRSKIGQKPIRKLANCTRLGIYYVCPTCNFRINKELRHCSDCGTKIDWLDI